MKRFAYSQFLTWKLKKGEHFLLLGGFTGVGKSYLAKTFAKNEFKHSFYIENFNPEVDIETSLAELPDESVIIIDNINGDKKRIVLFKELSVKFPDLYFILIDSFAREARGSDQSVSAEYIVLYPLTFEEFLLNTNEELYTKFASLKSVSSLDDELNNSLLTAFNNYLITGGMPEVVNEYIDKGLSGRVREIQKRILSNITQSLTSYYKRSEAKNLLSIINLIYPTLIRENSKFRLSDISASRRFISFKGYFRKLQNLNLIYISNTIKDRELDEKSFIIYFFDTGLLGAMGDVPLELYNREFILKNPVTAGLLNNFIACELLSISRSPVDNWSHNTAKIEFVLKGERGLLPIEFKNDESGKLKSLNAFNFYYPGTRLIRVNLDKPDRRGDVSTFPIYLVKTLYRNFIGQS